MRVWRVTGCGDVTGEMAMEERRLGVQINVLPAGTSAKQALEMVYRGEIVLSPQQMRAAIECLQFENPKVSAVAVTHMGSQSFAEALDRCIERSGKQPVPLPPPKVIEHEPPVSAEKMKRPFSRYRRY